MVTEHGEGGPITFACLDGCPPEKVADSADELERFMVDGEETPFIPLRHCPVEGWVVKLPLDEYAELLVEAGS